MKFMLINSDYLAFQKKLYAGHPGLAGRPYQEQLRVRLDSLFGLSDFYSRHLTALGHEAWDVHYDVKPLQTRWAKENGVSYQDTPGPLQFRLRRGIVPWVSRQADQRWRQEILAAQVKAYRPDVLYCLALYAFDSDFLRDLKGYYGVAVGQHASRLPDVDLSEYDLILSSLPNQVNYFRSQGVDSALFRLGFEPRVLTRLNDRPPRYPLTFVGGVGGDFSGGTRMLEELCRRQPVKVWGYGAERLPADSPIRPVHQGQAWGMQMYQILHDSKITFNRHINFAEDHANNMRLYESTGVGTLLLTDHKSDLHEIFEPGREVVVYHSAEEAAEMTRYYLEHESERQAIAAAGQQRTLRDYNYHVRMQELTALLERKLAGKLKSRTVFS